MVNVDLCSGTRSQAHSNLRLGGMTTLSYDKRPMVMAFGAPVHNTPLDASASGDFTYISIATDMHSRKLSMARTTVETLTSDCKSTSTTSAHFYRSPVWELELSPPGSALTPGSPAHWQGGGLSRSIGDGRERLSRN